LTLGLFSEFSPGKYETIEGTEGGIELLMAY